MDAAEICARLTGSAKTLTVDVRETVTSTNTVVKELAEQGAPEGTVVIAEQQSAGKGRMGRSFFSPKGTGLYMSILLRPGSSAENSLFITTAAAVAVAGAIETVTARRAMIKWVNDVYVDGYKVCGILTEASVDPGSGGLRHAVLGIGVNVKEPEGGFGAELSRIAGALYKTEPPAGTRAALAAEILNRFFEFYGNLTERAFLREYRDRSLLTGMEIHFTHGSEKSSGTVMGIDDAARLSVRLNSGETVFYGAGEVDVDKDFLDRLREKRERKA